MDFDLGRAQNGAHSRRTRVYPPRLADMGRRILPAPPTPYPRSRDHPERVVQRPLRDTGVSPTRMRMRDDRRGVESQILTPAKRTPRFDREKFLAEKYFFTCCFFGGIVCHNQDTLPQVPRSFTSGLPEILKSWSPANAPSHTSSWTRRLRKNYVPNDIFGMTRSGSHPNPDPKKPTLPSVSAKRSKTQSRSRLEYGRAIWLVLGIPRGCRP